MSSLSAFHIRNRGFIPDLLQRQHRETNVSRAASRGDLKFLAVPPGGGMRVPDLKIDEGYFVFDLITRMVRFLQPRDFPSGKHIHHLSRRLSIRFVFFRTAERLAVEQTRQYAAYARGNPPGLDVRLACGISRSHATFITGIPSVAFLVERYGRCISELNFCSQNVMFCIRWCTWRRDT